jgi:hypothetical protein
MATIDDMRSLGYAVGVAFPTDDDHVVYNVSGFGVQMYFRDDDEDALTSICDPYAHADRCFQFNNPEAQVVRMQLVQNGYAVTLDPKTGLLSVVGGSTKLTKLAPADLVAQAELPNLVPTPPSAAEAVLSALTGIADPDTATVADVVGAVAAALQQSA